MKENRLKSLSFRLPFLFVLSLVITTLVVVPLVYLRFYNKMIADYTRLAEGATQLMANAFDGDKTELYMEKNFELEEYRDLVDYYYTLRDNYPDTRFLYVYRFEEDGGHVIIDLDAEGVDNGDGYEPGYVYEVDAPTIPLLPAIMRGEQVPGYTVHNEEDGYLFTYLRPIFRSDGSYACSACVDFSLDEVQKQNISFTMNLFLILLAITLFVAGIGVYIVRKWVTRPVNELSACAGKFAYETEEDRRNNIDLLNELNINTGDEIESVYEVLKNVTRDGYLATANLRQAIDDIHDRDEQISEISKDAYRDALTEVGSALAFKHELETLDGEIQDGTACFAFVVFDLNNLKKVNDTYGHNVGDLYIKGSCKMICDHFKHSKVFRNGGDEFTAVLRNEDYDHRREKLEEIAQSFIEVFEDESREPWERYSVSFGMAEVTPEDTCCEEVLKRADTEMYTYKEAFHREHGNYR